MISLLKNRLAAIIYRISLCTLLIALSVVSTHAGNVTLPEFLAARLAREPITLRGSTNKAADIDDICPISTDRLARRVFAEYGAIYATESSVSIPWKCIFDRHEDVQEFQRSLKTRSALVDGVAIDLQEAAMIALVKAAEQAASENLRIIPFDGAIAGRRSYNDSVALWASRFFPALDHWVRLGKVSEADAETARSFNIRKQVEKVMEWESAGIFFSTDLTRSIFSSTAPPGTSQHLAMLAFDVQNYSNPRVRTILASNGWYQTVVNDPTHFTYLGVKEDELPERGLVMIDRGAYRFWVPRL